MSTDHWDDDRLEVGSHVQVGGREVIQNAPGTCLDKGSRCVEGMCGIHRRNAEFTHDGRNVGVSVDVGEVCGPGFAKLNL
jgi:hypothetical protein